MTIDTRLSFGIYRFQFRGIVVDGFVPVAIFFGVLGISVIIHEICHAYSAFLLGDATGKMDGRLSLNPLRHIDPFMTIIIPILTLMTMGFAFGGAKPVRINPLNFKNPSFGMMVTAAAGPLSNFALALLGFGGLYILFIVSPNLVAPGSYNALFFSAMIFVNVLLGVFNLIPIPPMDGSRILRHFVPQGGKVMLDVMEPFGLLVIVSLMQVLSRVVVSPILDYTRDIMRGVFGSSYASVMVETIRTMT